jgi:hypothetical protein
LHALEFRDRFLELLAFLGVGKAGLERALCQSHGLRADCGAVEVERAHRSAKALTFLADKVFGGHTHIVEIDWRVRCTAKPHLAFVAAEANARHFLRLDDEGADAVRARSVARPRHQHDEVGSDAVAAPLLAAIEDVAVAILFCARVDRGDIGTSLRLGDCDRGDDAALGDDWQELLALLLRAEMKKRHDEHGVEPCDGAAGGRDSRNLLARDAHHGEVAVRAAILLGHPQLHQSHLAEKLHDFSREAIGLVDFSGNRRHVLGDHLADVVAESRLLFGETHGRAVPR